MAYIYQVHSGNFDLGYVLGPEEITDTDNFEQDVNVTYKDDNMGWLEQAYANNNDQQSFAYGTWSYNPDDDEIDAVCPPWDNQLYEGEIEIHFC